MVATKLVNMRLDTGLLDRVDSVCGPRGRTGFVVAALEAALGDPSAGSAPAHDRKGSRTLSSPSPAPPRDFFDYAAAALERQARLNRERERR